MVSKQNQNALQAPDGSHYVTLTDGAGNLSPATGGGGGGNPNGQATMANSAPVVIASDQSAIPTTISGVSTAVNQTNGTQQSKITDGTNISAVKAASTAPVATDPALVTTLSPNSPGIVTLGQTVKSGSVPVTIASDQGNISNSPYPNGAVAITSSTIGTTAATVATLAGAASKTTYLCGFTITADATAALAGAATVAGTISGSLNYIQSVGAATSAQQLTQTFIPPIPASAVNTAITVTSAAAGTGGNTAVTAWGYQL